MAYVKVVPKEDWEVLEKYLYEDNGLILIPEPSLEQYFPQAMSNAIKAKNNANFNYDFRGGDPDFYAEDGTTPMHYAVDELLKDIKANAEK